MPPTPAPATTVLLLRDEPAPWPGAPAFSVFMVERSRQSRFMPGAMVFPGGRVDPADHEADEGEALSPSDAVQRFRGALAPGLALAHLRAGLREVEEETRARLPGPGALQALSRWVTPEVESRRFDTWFLVGRLPPGVDPAHDDYEVVSSRWVNPARALRDGELLAPPTWFTLWDLARFGAIEELLLDVARRPLPPIQPRFTELEQGHAVLLPWDAEHGEGARAPDGAAPSRLLMSQEQWWQVTAAERRVSAAGEV